jgi:hypothetical protein
MGVLPAMQLFLCAGLLPGLHSCAVVVTILRTLHAPDKVALVGHIVSR